MVKINLLPDVVLERRRQAKIRRTANAGLVAWAVLVLLVLGLAFGYDQLQSYRLDQKQAERDEVDAEANSPENVAFRQEALAVQSSLDALEELYGRRQLATQFLDALSRNIPENVRVSDLSYESDGTVRISGRAASYETVSTLENALKNSQSATGVEEESAAVGEVATGYFTGTALSGANIAGQGEVRFEMSTNYVAPDSTDPETVPDSNQGTQEEAGNG